MLTSRQRSYLSGLAQTREALVTLGKAGESEGIVARLDLLLDDHELVKLRFGDLKESKLEIATSLAAKTDSELIRVIGNVAVFYRLNHDPHKHKIDFPEPKGEPKVPGKRRQET